jgi:ferredoxin
MHAVWRAGADIHSEVAMSTSLASSTTAGKARRPDRPGRRGPALTTHTILEAPHLQFLFDALKERGYRLYGPRLGEGAIVYDEIHSASDLPAGWTDEQERGTYRLKKAGEAEHAAAPLFGYNSGPHSWKALLHPPAVRLWHAERPPAPDDRSAPAFSLHDDTPRPEKRAFIGVRSCDLHAIGIQDAVFLGDAYTDPQYRARREGLFIVAVNCGQAGATCFCASMGTGPKAVPEAGPGFDLALTEVLDPDRHYFVVETGSQAGIELLAALPHRPASPDEIARAERLVDATAHHMGRRMETQGLKELLYANADSPQWEAVAQRCLTCGNCTMVCPTCFCTTVEDVTDLAGAQAERWRKWDSCFTLGFSYIHGGSVRVSPASRYRQWLTHKLASWQDQFGTIGCVGCGRCITWCPVGIDITEEVAVMRAAGDEP